MTHNDLIRLIILVVSRKLGQHVLPHKYYYRYYCSYGKFLGSFRPLIDCTCRRVTYSRPRSNSNNRDDSTRLSHDTFQNDAMLQGSLVLCFGTMVTLVLSQCSSLHGPYCFQVNGLSRPLVTTTFSTDRYSASMPSDGSVHVGVQEPKHIDRTLIAFL